MQKLTRTSSQRGSALMISLVLITLMAALGAGLVQVQSAAHRRQAASLDRARALYVAEAGLAEAFCGLVQGRTGNVGTPLSPAQCRDGYFWVEATPNGDLVELVSTGLVGASRFSVGAIVNRRVNPVGELGLFGTQQVTVGAGSVISGTDSASLAGLFGPQPVPTRVGSNGDVILESQASGGLSVLASGWSGSLTGDTQVTGRVRPGPSGTVQIGSGVVVTGATAPNHDLEALPPIEVPHLKVSSVSDILPGTLRTFGPGDVHISSFALASTSQVTLVGPVTLVVDAWTMEPQSTLVFDASAGAIVIHVVNTLTLKPDSTLGVTGGTAPDMAILIGPNVGDIELQAGGTFTGLLYAPDHALELSAALQVQGAIVADEVHLAEGTLFTFDAAIATQGVGVQLLPRLLNWSIEPLPNEPIVKSMLPTDVYMTMNGLSATPMEDAHADRDLTLDYYDLAGDPQTYTGSASALDFTQVGQVMKMQWTDADSGRALDPVAPSL